MSKKVMKNHLKQHNYNKKLNINKNLIKRKHKYNMKLNINKNLIQTK